MNYGDITDSVWCWTCACTNDLENVTDKTWNGREIVRRPAPNEIEVISFPQSWPNTSLGFKPGGLAGQAISTAQTTICIGPMGDAAVYCAKGLMYTIQKPNDKFFQDVYARNIVRQGLHRQYETVTPEETPPAPTADQP